MGTCLWLGLAALAVATAPTPPRLTLDAALEAAGAVPQLQAAQAQTASAQSDADSARAALLPSLSGSADYQRTTVNFVPRPGYVLGSPSLNTNSLRYSNQSDNYWTLGLTAQWLVYDFHASIDSWRAAQGTAAASRSSEQAVARRIACQVRTAFFAACRAQAQVRVSTAAQANQARHCAQIAAQIAAGARPEIDLAQARADLATANLARVQAARDAAVSRLTLSQAMGVAGPANFFVVEQQMPPVEAAADATFWVAAAQRQRPDLHTLQASLLAADLALRAAYGAYFPSLRVGGGFTDQGGDLGRLGWNWLVRATLSWDLYAGGQCAAKAAAARAQQLAAQAELRTLQLQIELQVRQALQAIADAQALLTAAAAAQDSTALLLQAAEGRLAAGTGSALELGDAQLQHTQAAATHVGALYDLSSARAIFLQAVGPPQDGP